MFCHLLTIFLLLSIITLCHGTRNDPDYRSNTRKLIISRGFRYEEHDVITSDGYILKTFRMLHPHSPPDKTPVILMHGLFSSSRDFLVSGPDGHVREDTRRVGNNLGFELAKRGYDVWLGNSRGNTYSQNHIKFPNKHKVNKNRSFWNFTHSDIAEKDIPAIVKHVLRETGAKTTAYIGHSRGTVVMFAALSLFPYLNGLIRPFIALAPVATMRYSSRLLSKIPFTSPYAPPHYKPVMQEDVIPANVKKTICSHANGIICASFFTPLGGDGVDVFNGTRMPVYFSGLPAGSSAKDVRQFSGNMRTGKFARFDYGVLKNLSKFRSVSPPEYKLENITNHHIYLIKGPADVLADAADTDKLRKALKTRIREDMVIPVPTWGHNAMLLGAETGKYVNTPVIEFLQRYE